MLFERNAFQRCIRPGAQLIAVAAFSAIALGATSANAATSKWVATQTAAFTPTGGKLVGSLANGTPIHIAVGLSLVNRPALEKFVVAQQTPGNPSFHQFLSRDQFTKLYSPTSAQSKAVVDYLVKSGFTNVKLAPNRLLVTADGSAATVRSAFNTDLAEYSYNGQRVFANTKPAQVPSSLGSTVLSVVGLQNAERGHTMFSKIDGGKVNAASTPFYPTQFPQVYNAGETPTAASVPVGIFAEGDMTQALADLAQFESEHELPATPTSVELVDGGSTDTSGTAEWDIDSQDIVGISGGVASLTFYAGPDLSYTHMDDEFNQIVSDNAVPLINVSIGGCEISAKLSGATATADQSFLEGNAQGQTFFISTGDSGSAECGRIIPGQSWPAISPYVVAVGGTSLYADGNGNYSSESVWSGGGGGPSVTEPKPSWQTSTSTITYASRGVPDVSLDANPSTGVYVILDGSTVCCYGGTSLAAPLTTGIFARYTAAVGNRGLPTPMIYASVPYIPGAMHDVTSGSNGRYTAATGWDYASGFGSFDISAFLAATGG